MYRYAFCGLRYVWIANCPWASEMSKSRNTTRFPEKEKETSHWMAGCHLFNCCCTNLTSLCRLQLTGFSVAECSQLIEKTLQNCLCESRKWDKRTSSFSDKPTQARWTPDGFNMHSVEIGMWCKAPWKTRPNQFSHLGSRRISSGWISVAIGYFSMIPHRVWDEVEVWVFSKKQLKASDARLLGWCWKKLHLIALAEHIFAQAARRVQFRTKRVAMGLWKSLLFACHGLSWKVPSEASGIHPKIIYQPETNTLWLFNIAMV